MLHTGIQPATRALKLVSRGDLNQKENRAVIVSNHLTTLKKPDLKQK